METNGFIGCAKMKHSRWRHLKSASIFYFRVELSLPPDSSIFAASHKPKREDSPNSKQTWPVTWCHWRWWSSAAERRPGSILSCDPLPRASCWASGPFFRAHLTKTYRFLNLLSLLETRLSTSLVYYKGTIIVLLQLQLLLHYYCCADCWSVRWYLHSCTTTV